MPIAQAAEMVQNAQAKTNNIQTQGTQAKPLLIPHDPRTDDEALRKLAWHLQQQITPQVETETLDEKPWAGCARHQRESLIGEISGVTHLFGGEIPLLQETGRLLHRFGLAGRIAIADSVGAAWAMAHFGSLDTSVGPTNATPTDGPPRLGQWIVPSGAMRSMLEPLPTASLRINVATAETLARLGVERVGELLRLPRQGLAARLGSSLVQRIDQALGQREETLSAQAAPAEHQQTWQLEYPTSDQAILGDRIRRLMKSIRTGLAARQRGALRVTCRLDLSIHPPLFLEVGLFAPTVDDEHLSGLLIHRLENIRLASDVTQITVAVTLTGPLRTAQISLFETDTSAASLAGSTLSRLVDSLSGRMGRESVLRVELQEDPLPEQAYRTFPLTGGQRNGVGVRRNRSLPAASAAPQRGDAIGAGTLGRSFDLPSADDAMRRPLFLFPDPIPLAVALPNQSFRQTVSDGRLPQQIRWGGVVHTVLRHWGPERIETGWWKGPTIRRDYYRIETDRGGWWWIFRTLAGPQSRWMLHGQFD